MCQSGTVRENAKDRAVETGGPEKNRSSGRRGSTPQPRPPSRTLTRTEEPGRDRTSGGWRPCPRPGAAVCQRHAAGEPNPFGRQPNASIPPGNDGFSVSTNRSSRHAKVESLVGDEPIRIPFPRCLYKPE
jgi:hypothetical protein